MQIFKILVLFVFSVLPSISYAQRSTYPVPDRYYDYHYYDRHYHDRDYDRGQFSIYTRNQGELRCSDYGARLLSCQDIGDGRNHGCDTLGDFGCRAWEGHGNKGSAGCEAVCARY